MRTRPATPADLPAITALYREDDVRWFGAPEHDEGEVREEFAPVDDLARQSVLVFDDDGLAGAAWWWGRQTTLLAGGAHRSEVIAGLLDVAIAGGVRELYALDRDHELIDAVTGRGWRHRHSAFDLGRDVSAAWTLPEPNWPDGVRVAAARADDLAALHTLIYDDARWADVDGHAHRDFAEWRTVFWRDADPSANLVARRAGRPLGAVLTRTFSDGTGYISQLAVASDERGNGLGRALLLAGLRNRRYAGASRLCLGVQAANNTALALYRSVGLEIEREYRGFGPPPP